MSLQAQFYEAQRRQHFVDHRQSLGVARQVQQSKYQSRYIPVGVLREDDMFVPWTYNPLRRTQSSANAQTWSQKEQDPRPPPPVPEKERYVHYGKLQKRYTSTDYIQQR
ncbi:unnamed protein product [Adineta steineri]|uniref:Uncharacterized protein n=1 Tax=Adineta steineri TaxID=433720 RepID=A0A813UYV3_9BILA|nr:unnamed protein product [Adineta steineri]CAF0870287.1 unnamed protein product [Adineta steineri]CAF1015685.1 unnamed protein product [Adineta steineri]